MSRSTAQSVDRPTLAPTWLIVLLTTMVGGALWLLYPRQDLEKRLATSGDVELSIAYLSNLLQSDGGNMQLRLLLAKRQVLFGDTLAARTTLQPILDSAPAEAREAGRWVLLDALQLDYQRASIAGDVDREQALEASLQQQASLLSRQQLTPPQHARLVSLAGQMQESRLSAELARQQSPQGPQMPDAAHAYADAAKQALGQSDYVGCADLYIQARNAAQDPVAKKQYFYAAVTALRSGNQPVAALALAERELGDLAHDTQTLVFMVELARAAGKPAVAERYARQMLKISLLQQWRQEAGHLLAAAPRARPEADADVFDDGAHFLVPQPALRRVAASEQELDVPEAQRAPAQEAPRTAFDDKTYLLGYQVFVENGKLDDAWAVANAAVRQNPSSMAWRERLARVSEWTSRAQVALEQWLAIARATGSGLAWQSVLRLSPELFDDAALAQALRHELQSKPEDFQLLQEFVQAQERQGEPQVAIAYLRQHAQTPAALELLAQLAERAGHPALALQSWGRLLDDPSQVTADRALHAAVLAMEQGQHEQGWKWMLAAQGHAVPEADQAGFLRLTGQLAETHQADDMAIQAYRQLIENKEAELSDYDAVIRLEQHDHPLESARVSMMAWRRFHQSRYLIAALSTYVDRSQWEAFGSAMKELGSASQAGPQTLQALQRNPQFLRLVGTYHENEGRLDEARRYLEEGLRLAPDSADMQQALLWLLIDGNDAVAIRKMLAEHEARWSRNPEVHDALAAAYQALSLPRVALVRYLTPHFDGHKEDFLWLMNYADALDQNQQSDRAWRLRRTVMAMQWKQLQQRAEGAHLTRAQALHQWLSSEGLDATRRVARARLLMDRRPGDPAVQVLRELLRQGRGADVELSNAAAETALGWLQDQGEYSAERAYLWHQYARSRSQRSNLPLWAEITVALAQGDRLATGDLLQKFDQRLPRYDRVDAAARVGDVRLAQTAAFETQEQQRDDEPLQQQLNENLLAFGNAAQVRLRHESFDGLVENGADNTLHLALSPSLALDLGYRRINRSIVSSTTFMAVPDEEEISGVLRSKHRNGFTQLRVASRVGYAHTTPISLLHEQSIDGRLTWRGEMDWHQPADESTTLRMAGMRDRLALGLRYQMTRQDSFDLSLSGDRYRLQTGAGLGSGRHGMLEYTHVYRQEAPSLEYGAFWSVHGFTRTDPAILGAQGRIFQRYVLGENTSMGPDFFVPDNFRFYGVRISTNTHFEQDYSRALRPYASLSRTWHSALGPGYGVSLGVAGNVLGADHLRLSWELSKSGMQSSGMTHSLQVAYQLFF